MAKAGENWVASTPFQMEIYMPPVVFPHAPTPHNAPANNAWLAQQYLDAPNSAINGRQPAHGERCGCCNRKPESDELCEVILDPATCDYARIGIGRCHHDFFRAALEALLVAETAGAHANRTARILKLQTAIAALPRNL